MEQKVKDFINRGFERGDTELLITFSHKEDENDGFTETFTNATNAIIFTTALENEYNYEF